MGKMSKKANNRLWAASLAVTGLAAGGALPDWLVRLPGVLCLAALLAPAFTTVRRLRG